MFRTAGFTHPLALIATFSLAIPLLVFSATPTAEAALTGCKVLPHATQPEYGRMSRCTSGNGWQRIKLRCNPGHIYNDPDFYVYGPWKKRGEYSGSTCFSGKTSGFYRSATIERS